MPLGGLFNPLLEESVNPLTLGFLKVSEPHRPCPRAAGGLSTPARDVFEPPDFGVSRAGGYPCRISKKLNQSIAKK